MAKKRRVAKSRPAVDLGSDRKREVRAFDPILIATGLLGAAIAYLMYHPSDAAQVERGDALWFGLLSLAICLFTFIFRSGSAQAVRSNRNQHPNLPEGSRPAANKSIRNLRNSCCLDVSVWSLAIWIMFVAFANSEVGNLRMATNEAWLWISGAAMFTAVRRLAVRQQSRKAIAGLLVVCSVGLAVYALHQEWVTLPIDRAAFEKDPDRVVKAAGIDAPPNSAERSVFAGRLFDGGPTATFALANSLAAVLIAGALFSAGIARYSFARFTQFQAAVWITIIILCSVALWATQSRSALVASLFGVGLICLGGSGSLRQSILQRSRMLAGLAATACCFAGLIWWMKPSWFASAYASVAFRLQYWRATLRMIADRPWFGAGPGNYQSMYDRYRDETTSEQIVDPHNLIFETLGSGGLIGLILLVICAVLASKVISVDRSEEICSGSGNGTNDSRAVWIGACIAVAMVWLFGFAVRQLPDVDASLYVLPVVAMFGYVVKSSANVVESPDLDRLMLIILFSVGMHLMFSGGWTVPGVAIVIWVCAGVVARVDVDVDTEPETARNFRVSFWAGGLGLLLMVLLYCFSIRPVQNAQRMIAIAANAIDHGRFGVAERFYGKATIFDPWSPDANLGLADLQRWKLIREDSDQVRREWEADLKQAKSRGGQNPTLLRVIGVQQLHLYQRYGQREDLDAAAATFETAVAWSPVNQWMIAQLAAIVREQGDADRAQELADQAKHLSELGINSERGFRFQLIYPAQHFGEIAKREVIRRSAPQVLSEQQ